MYGTINTALGMGAERAVGGAQNAGSVWQTRRLS
jgi:hypothetical protein